MTSSQLRGLVVLLLFSGAAAVGAALWRPDLMELLLPVADEAPNVAALTDASTKDETGRGTISYVLDDRRWTAFALPGRLTSLRILSHPDVASDHLPLPGETFRYGFEIEVLDENNIVLLRKTQFFRTELVTYRDAVGGAEVTARRYSDNPALPLAVDRLILGLEDVPGARRVQVRTKARDPGLTAVNLRFYRPRAYNEGNVSALWERLPLTEKRALSVGYIYPPDLLTQEERQAILSHRWLPFGPIGIEGRDYVSRRLEIYDPPGDRVVEAKTVLDGGLYLDLDRKAGISLPEAFEALQITAIHPKTLLGADGLRVAPITLLAEVEQLFGRGSEVRSIRTDASGEARLEGLNGGRLILSASEPVWLQVTSVDVDGKTRVLTEEVPRTRYQFADAGMPLRLQTRPNLGMDVPLRLDLRALGGGTRSVSLRMLDEAGILLAKEVVSLASLPSLYDRDVDAPEAALSETETVYLFLTPSVARLDVAVDGPIAVAAYMRPVGIPRRLDVPESYFARSRARDDNRSWFRVKASAPEGGPARDMVIERPVRAADVDTLVDPDALEWENFTPLGDWTARRAFVPRSQQALSASARGIFFQPVRVGEDVPLAVEPDTYDAALSPKLIVPPGIETARYEASVDGQVIWEATLPANARASLAPLPDGARSLRFSGPEGVQLLVSGLVVDRPGYIERQLLRLAPGTSSFEVVKRGSGREVLAIRIIPVASSRQRATLTVGLNFERARNTVLSAWSDHSRTFSIRLSGAGRRAILQQTGHSLGPEQRMFMVLDEDIPQGNYTMSLTLDHDRELFALISRAAPMLDGQIDFSYEQREALQ